MSLQETAQQLFTRGRLAGTLADDNWCQAQDFKPELSDSDKLGIYHCSFYIKPDEVDLHHEDLERCFIHPARLSMAREFVKQGKNLELGEPVVSDIPLDDGRHLLILQIPYREVSHAPRNC